MLKEWKVYKKEPDAEKLAQAAGITPVVANLLLHRGIRTAEEAKAFLHPEQMPFHDPFAMKDMDKAVSRIRTAIEAGEHIVVYGDYDVDGITSTTLMLRSLRALGANVDYYIPDRSEGYGFNAPALEKLAADHDLLLSVDCGIASADLVARVKDKMDFVITDHHLPGKELPPAIAVVNPHREDDAYPFKELCGCGVAFKLCQALWKDMKGESFERDIELVALGTVADVVLLRDENRKIVKQGLAVMKQTRIPGLQALLKVLELDKPDKKITSGTIGFQIGPRLNSAGRMESARIGVELLMSPTVKEGIPLAEHLNELNSKRQAVEQDILARAEEQLASDLSGAPEDMPAIVVAGKDWNPGVIGIVGSRLVEKYYKPTIVCCIQEDGTCKGSCRSIEGLNMFEALTSCKDDLIQFGGHAMAAGLSLRAENIDKLREDFGAYAKSHLSKEDYVPKIDIEAEIPPEEVTEAIVNELDALEPYGEGNQKPLFGVRDVRAWGARAIGKESQHLMFNIGTQEHRIHSVCWNRADLVNAVNNEVLDIVYVPEINEWNGYRNIEIFVNSLDPAQGERQIPSRDTLANIYRQLHQLQHQEGSIRYTDADLATMFSQRYQHISLYTMGMGLRVFEELGLLVETEEGHRSLPPTQQHMDLMASPTYRRCHEHGAME